MNKINKIKCSLTKNCSVEKEDSVTTMKIEIILEIVREGKNNILKGHKKYFRTYKNILTMISVLQDNGLESITLFSLEIKRTAS